jgi:hypothetical protein
MTAVRMPNNMEGDGPVIPPLHENGQAFAYCMYFNGNVDVAFADTLNDLLDALIPGYTSLNGADQDFQRIRLSQSVAAQVQAEILASLEPNQVTAEEYAVLSAPRGISQPRADWWTCPVPLVVVETGYEPFTAIPRPASGLSDGLSAPDNLWFIRPSEEEDFLISLHEVGYIRLMENSYTGEL